jgi:hypothetical protein
MKGDEGRGRCPARPAKVLRVGVFAEGSSVRTSWGGLESVKKLLFGRGVVGVVSSPGRPGGGSGTARVVLTAWKVDMSKAGGSSSSGGGGGGSGSKGRVGVVVL